MTALFSVCLFFSCLPVDVCVIAEECCKRWNEEGGPHNEHKTHTELWDVKSLNVYCLFLYTRPRKLPTCITDSNRNVFSLTCLLSSTSSTQLKLTTGFYLKSTKTRCKPKRKWWKTSRSLLQCLVVSFLATVSPRCHTFTPNSPHFKNSAPIDLHLFWITSHLYKLLKPWCTTYKMPNFYGSAVCKTN